VERKLALAPHRIPKQEDGIQAKQTAPFKMLSYGLRSNISFVDLTEFTFRADSRRISGLDDFIASSIDFDLTPTVAARRSDTSRQCISCRQCISLS